jgi:hypothetical protein
MKYFLHDTNAMEDERVSELLMKFGYEGVGLFYCALEKFAKQEKPIKTSVLKRQLNVGKKLERCWLFMEELGLICTSNGESFNNKLLNFSETMKEKRKKTLERVSEYRDRQKVTETVTRYNRVSNAPNSIVYNSIINNSAINISFDEFWNLYDKRVNKQKAEKKWNSLSNRDRELAMEHLPSYIKATADKQYRKDPTTYLNNQSWNDEIITAQPQLKKVNGYAVVDQSSNQDLFKVH